MSAARRQRLTRVRERRLEDFDTDGRELRLKRKDLSDGEAGSRLEEVISRSLELLYSLRLACLISLN